MRILLFLLLLTVSVPATAGPVVFGESWDGTPPGHLGNVLNMDNVFTQGASPFAAGSYELSIDGCISAWCNQHTLQIGQGANAVTPNGQPGKLQFSVNESFEIFAFSPSITGASSFGSQWIFYQVNATTWIWGLEDILTSEGDNDYQDLYGTLRLSDVTPIPTPEPGSLILLGSGLTAVVAYHRRRRKRDTR